MRQEAFKAVYSVFQNVFAFCVHSGKYDFSLAIDYCLISHKSSEQREKKKKKTAPKNKSEILIYFHEICLHVIFYGNKITFSPCKFFTKKVCLTIPPVFITSFFSVKGT